MMKAIFIALLALNVKADGGKQNIITSCKKVSDCACKTNNGIDINLKSLGRVHWEDPKTPKTKQDFTWEPCTLFSIGSLKAVTAAQHDPNGNMYYDIGTDPNVDFLVSTAGVVELKMQSADKKLTAIGKVSTMMKAIFIVLLALNVKAVGGKQNIITSCKKVSDCACETDNGTVINLKGLGRVHWEDPTTPKTKQDYTWEPCALFSIGSLKAVTAAQHDPNGNLYYDIGTDPNVDFQFSSPGVVELKMQSADKTRTSLVNLICSTSTSWTFEQESPPLTYQFKLISPLACPLPPVSNSSSGISIGTIITITFFVLLLSYFVFGVLFKVFARKAQGAERVPNLGFWTALPTLIRDGFKFTFTCGNRSTHYDQI